jgi:hypothetical protein
MYWKQILEFLGKVEVVLMRLAAFLVLMAFLYRFVSAQVGAGF